MTLDSGGANEKQILFNEVKYRTISLSMPKSTVLIVMRLPQGRGGLDKTIEMAMR